MPRLDLSATLACFRIRSTRTKALLVEVLGSVAHGLEEAVEATEASGAKEPFGVKEPIGDFEELKLRQLLSVLVAIAFCDE